MYLQLQKKVSKCSEEQKENNIHDGLNINFDGGSFFWGPANRNIHSPYCQCFHEEAILPLQQIFDVEVKRFLKSLFRTCLPFKRWIFAKHESGDPKPCKYACKRMDFLLLNRPVVLSWQYKRSNWFDSIPHVPTHCNQTEAGQNNSLVPNEC